MANFSAAEARQHFGEILDRATFKNERTVLTRRGRPVAAIVPIGDLQALEAAEDEADNAEANRRLQLLEEGEEALIPWEKVKTQQGL